MNLSQLNALAVEFNINPSDISFYGEHDVVYLDVPEDSLPDWSAMTDEEREAFTDTYDLLKVEGYWGFFT